MTQKFASPPRSPIPRKSFRQRRRAGLRALSNLVQPGPAESAASRQARTLDTLIKFYGDQQTVVRLAGFSLRSLANYKTGQRLLHGAGERRIHELGRLKDGLATIMKPDAVSSWLQRPNSLFDGLKPIEVIERGHTDQLWRMIHLGESGSPS